jgi:hypothetical protein
MNYTTSYIIQKSIHSKINYDSFEDIKFYTKRFSEHMDEIEIIDFEHKFFVFLSAITNLEEIKEKIYHCYYHKETKKMKMIVSSTIDRKLLNVIYHAWSKYWKVDFNSSDAGTTVKLNLVTFYSIYCGELYVMDDYELDEKEYYKYGSELYQS